jgi:hypothetical protein
MIIIFAATLFIAAVLAYAMLMKNVKVEKTKKNSDASAELEAGAEKDEKEAEPTIYSREDVILILNSLLKSNILLRKDKEISTEVIKQVEVIIDDLIILVPAMMKQYPDESLTHEINSIGGEHFHKIIKRYLLLSLENREGQLKEFQKTITSLYKVTKKARSIMEKDETLEFKKMADLLAKKFHK